MEPQTFMGKLYDIPPDKGTSSINLNYDKSNNVNK